MKVMRKIIEINDELCNGCGECVPSCAEGALEIIDGKARMLAEKYCDGLGACLGECPTGALRIVERQADDFDEAAVEELLRRKKKAEPEPPPLACGCAGSNLQSFKPVTPCQTANQPIRLAGAAATSSALTHWPVQIRLVPPTAPFLKNADILVAADCTPIAYPDFHRDFLKDRVVMMGCPKFDEQEMYIQRFAEIFATARPKSVLVAIMEVPCCAGMRKIVRDGLQRSGVKMDIDEVVISARGQVLRQGKMS